MGCGASYEVTIRDDALTWISDNDNDITLHPLNSGVTEAFEYLICWGMEFFNKSLKHKTKNPSYENHEIPGRQVVAFDCNEKDPMIKKHYNILLDQAIDILKDSFEAEDCKELWKMASFKSSILRLNFYTKEGSTCPPHTDTALLTLLADSCGGLQVYDRDLKKWGDVPHGHVTAFPGRFLYCLTDGKSSRPTRHRVVSSKERISVSFFLRPDEDAPLQIPRTDGIVTTYSEINKNRKFPDPWEELTK
eukprot:TRINITY_DN3959_c0_g1_i1.p1 TRINITY_DN3959_c0_g1~~TRINITY_DN3959_c0_g1_i1.p1  ORF type:complete len:248 (+),score=38.74 TRINITY_DN3959_c0_g1_i1:147-890(+)